MTIAPPRSDTVDLVEFRALFEEARQRRRQRRRMAGATIAIVVALVAGLCMLVASGSERGRGPNTSPLGPHRLGTFAHPTGVVLVFADGLSLDLDHRTVAVRAIAGQRAGDQRWDIVRAGDSVVVGWGQVWASAIAGGAPRMLGPVVTFVPAAEAGTVWLVNYPGGRIGEGTPTLSEVTTTGRVIQSELGPPPLSGVPIVGIPGGLAFETSTGVAFWNAKQQRVHSSDRNRARASLPTRPGETCPGAKACARPCMSLQWLDLTKSSPPHKQGGCSSQTPFG